MCKKYIICFKKKVYRLQSNKITFLISHFTLELTMLQRKHFIYVNLQLVLVSTCDSENNIKYSRWESAVLFLPFQEAFSRNCTRQHEVSWDVSRYKWQHCYLLTFFITFHTALNRFRSLYCVFDRYLCYDRSLHTYKTYMNVRWYKRDGTKCVSQVFDFVETKWVI